MARIKYTNINMRPESLAVVHEQRVRLGLVRCEEVPDAW